MKPAEAQAFALKVLKTILTPDRLRNLPPYTELLEYLQGNPLAIQVIMPELERKEPSELLESLRSGTAALSFDDPEQGRARSLTASLNYRLGSLDPEIRRRLSLLGLFQGKLGIVQIDLCLKHVELL